MNMWALAGFSIVALLVVIYWVFFMGQGRKVLILVYEKAKNGDAIPLYPSRKLIGHIKRTKKQVKFKLPRILSKLAISPPTSEQFTYAQSSKYPVVSLLKLAEDQYVYLKPTVTNDKNLNVDVISNADWVTYIDEAELITQTFAGAKDWLQKYGAIIVMGLIFISGLLTVHLVNQHSVELIEEHRGDALRQVEENRDLLERITETLNNGEPQSNNKEETDAVKPLGNNQNG